MSEELVVRHCSPTLAGMKTGNIFSHTFADEEEMRETIRRLNRILVKKGLRVLPLRSRENRTMIYVYRPVHLLRDLQHGTACRLLKERGYCCENPQRCIMHLRRRLSESEDFPHEIGLFLGYPPEDVNGFIENRDEGCKLVGCWKVYGDEDSARKLFAKFKKCTSVYCRQWEKGKPMEKLALAFGC